MSFWTTVGAAYVVVLAVGLLIGRHLAARFRRGGRGGSAVAPVSPVPPTPSFGLECPPLGSDFDRALLPAAFPDVEATAAA
jgi:hypothetical protein